tara:strand:+ start:410 stop:676 length:267 start_codon:yes stop_codon:yes gene_type:complete
MEDLNIILKVKNDVNNSLRNIKSLEEIATEFYINDLEDPMLYLLYLKLNKSKLNSNEINQITETIDLLKLKNKKDNDYNKNYLKNTSL